MQRCGIVPIGLRRFSKGCCDLFLRFAKDHTCLALAFCLRLAGHCILQVLRDDNVTDLDRIHSHTPGRRAFVDDLLKLLVDDAASNQDICQHHPADNVAQGGLGSPIDSAAVILYLQCSLLCIPDNPEQDGINIDRNRVLRQCFLRCEGRHHDTMIDPGCNRVDDGNNPKHTWTA